MKWVHMKSNIDLDDNELISLLPEDPENVKNLIYEKYGYIIDVLIRKYYNVMQIFHIDEQEVRCEASYGFSDGINCYVDNRNASLKTFLSLCVERRITKYLSKFTTQKAYILNDTLSLDYVNDKTPLVEMISDDNKFEPLTNLTQFETIDEIINKAKEVLSSSEYEVFEYMLNQVSYIDIAKKLEKTPKQIDNAIQRIKVKMRKVFDEIKIN